MLAHDNKYVKVKIVKNLNHSKPRPSEIYLPSLSVMFVERKMYIILEIRKHDETLTFTLNV